MKRVTFYYVRHGKTEFNRDGVIQGGRVDSPLVPETLPEIERSARALAGVGTDRCYCSPQGRAQRTARLLLEGIGAAEAQGAPSEAGRPVPEGSASAAGRLGPAGLLGVNTLDDLREFDFGDIDGKRHADYGKQFVRCFIRQDFSSVGGESGRQVRARVRRAFSRMLAESSDGDAVLVVAHGSLFRYVMLEFATDMSPLRRRLASLTMRMPNASIGVVVGTDASEGERGDGANDGPAGVADAASGDGAGRGTSFRLVQMPLSGEDFVKKGYAGA
jgi:broad specificity phosphatase PhoE